MTQRLTRDVFCVYINLEHRDLSNCDYYLDECETEMIGIPQAKRRIKDCN